MSLVGAVDTGVQQSNKGKLEIRAGSNTVAQADSNGVKTDFAFRHSNTITGNVTIASTENCVMAGPIQIDGILTVEGTLVIL